MHALKLRTLALSFIVVAAAACGKQSAPVGDTTANKTEPKPADSAEAADSATGASATEKKDAKSPSKADEESMAVTRKAKDYITAEDAVFMYAFNASDAKEKAEKTCGEKSKGDSAKQAACMTAAQKKLGIDGYHFVKDEAGDKWYWEIVKVKNNVVHNLHKYPIEFADETENAITVKVVGKDEVKGAAGKPPSEVKFEVPNGYQIIQNDPDQGKIVFEAKLGLLGDPSKRKR